MASAVRFSIKEFVAFSKSGSIIVLEVYNELFCAITKFEDSVGFVLKEKKLSVINKKVPNKIITEIHPTSFLHLILKGQLIGILLE
jgi:hypothetical protein